MASKTLANDPRARQRLRWIEHYEQVTNGLKWINKRKHQLSQLSRLYRHTFKIQEVPNLHAKLLIVDDQKAYFGSHNLTEKGVEFGTVECGIISSDTELVQNLSNIYTGFKNRRAKRN